MNPTTYKKVLLRIIKDRGCPDELPASEAGCHYCTLCRRERVQDSGGIIDDERIYIEAIKEYRRRRYLKKDLLKVLL